MIAKLSDDSLSDQILCTESEATLTGLEPATSAVTGRRANQLRYRALLCADWHREKLYQSHPCCTKSRFRELRTTICGLSPQTPFHRSTPNGIRTRAAAVKGRCPRPLDDGGPIPDGNL